METYRTNINRFLGMLLERILEISLIISKKKTFKNRNACLTDILVKSYNFIKESFAQDAKTKPFG